MTNISIKLPKLRTYLSNVQTQLKLEKISSLEKDTRIKTLEDLVIKLGYDPGDVKALKEVIKNKNANIAALRKQLKFPFTEHPMKKEIEESEKHNEDMLKLIIEKNIQMKELEEQIEKLLKEKEEDAQLITSLVKTIPIVVVDTTGYSTSTPNDLNKVVQDLSLQTQENYKLQQKLKHVEAQKIKNDSLLVEEKSHQLAKKIDQLEN